MIQSFVDYFITNKYRLREYLQTTPQRYYDTYKALLIKTIELCFPPDKLDLSNLVEIDHGDYQGSLLYLIPLDTYQPNPDEYVTTYVYYGSCSGCDTLLSISCYDDGLPTEAQINEYLTLCLHMVERMEWFREGWRQKYLEDY